MTNEEFIQAVLSGYAEILMVCLPIALFIGGCNLAFNIICSAFFGGRLSFSRRGD